MEEWNLHKRIVLRIITIFGGSPQSLILGFMFSAALISIWISNTTTALMILPIGLSVINKLEDQFGQQRTHNFSVVILLSIVYSCSNGGISIIIGTPPNLVMVKMLKVLFPGAPEI
jgi:sodium-dependent dicarboxylate transporter 2/3/5